MTAEELLTKLEKGGLVAPEIVASLRKQCAASKEPIAPAAVAKLLVDKGHLTAGQAQRLLEQPSASQIAKQPATTGTAAAAGTSKISKPASPSAIQNAATPAPKPAPKPPPAHNSSVHDDLGLAPLEELEVLPSPAPASAVSKTPATQPAAKSAIKPAAKPAPAKTAPAPAPALDNLGLAPLDDLGLAPLEEHSPASPQALAPAAKSTIQKAAPAAKSTIQKAAQPAAPQKSAIQKSPAAPAPAAAAGLDDLPPLDDLGGLTALDELPSLDALSADPLGSPLGADPLGSVGATADLGALATQTTALKKPQITPATVAAVQAAQESRTTLFVGLGIGGAALLVVAIGLAVYFWPRGNGMLEFQAAEQAYVEKQYAAAAEKYDQLLRLHPRHEQLSLVRVHRGMCAIQGANSAPPDWVRLLPVVSETTESLAAEPAIGQVHAELAPLLIKMTEELADAATSQKVDEQSASRLQQARAALALCNDSRLLPSTLRPWQKLADIEERLQLLARDMHRSAARDQAKAALTQALTAGNLAAAQQARAALLANYPDLSADPLWSELRPDWNSAATKAVKTNADKRPAERDPAKSAVLNLQPWQVLNARLQENAPPVGERVALVTAAGGVHAVDASNGQARWSRYLALEPHERVLQSTDGKLAWLVDRQANELLSVNANTGNLLWRQPLGERPAGLPILLNGKIHLSLTNGAVQTFDSGSGELQATAQLPHRLKVGPVVTDDGLTLLQLADESILYLLNIADLQCKSAYYLGHDSGMAVFSPVMFQRQCVIPMQVGDRFELLLLDIENTSPSLKSQKAPGLIGAPLVVAGKRLCVSTTDGTVLVLELAENDFKVVQTLTSASSADKNAPALLRHLQTTSEGIIAADRGLSLLKFDAAGKLQPGWSAFSVDLFDGSGTVHDQSLIGGRYVADQDAHFAAAVNTTDGLATWQTPLQLPLTLLADKEEGSKPVAVPAAVVAKLLTLDAATADLNAEFKRLLSQPVNVNLKASQISEPISLGDEQLLVPARGARELLLVKPADYSVRKLKLPGQSAGRPAVSGQQVLVPLSDGSIQSLNSASGEVTAAPFLLPGSPSASAPVTVIALDDAGKEAVVCDGQRSILRIGLVTEPKPHWVEQAGVRLAEPLAAPPVALAEAVFAVDRRGMVHVYSLPDLTSGQSVDLKGGQVTWGPHRAGDAVVVATDRDELWCFDAVRQPRWQQALSHGQVIGLPLVRDTKLVFATAAGGLEVRAAGSGDLTASANLGQPLAGSALLSGNTVWLTTACGQVLQASLPTEVAP